MGVEPRSACNNVIFSNSEVLIITHNHKLAKVIPKRLGTKIDNTEFELTELRNLVIGDKIRVHVNALDDYVNFGENGDYEEGLVMGWLTGDGCFSYHSDKEKYPDIILDFWEKEWDIADEILKIFKKWNYDLKLGTNGSNKVKRIRTNVYTDRFANKYQYNIWDFKSSNKRLKFLDNATKDFIRGYLSSYFSSDGTICCNNKEKSYSISLASINEDRLKQIKYIFNIFGIKSFVSLMRKAGESYFENGGGKFKTKDCFRLVISGIENIEKFVLPSQVKKIQQNDKTVLKELVLPAWVNWELLYDWASTKKTGSGKTCILCNLDAGNGVFFLEKYICESCFLKLKNI